MITLAMPSNPSSVSETPVDFRVFFQDPVECMSPYRVGPGDYNTFANEEDQIGNHLFVSGSTLKLLQEKSMAQVAGGLYINLCDPEVIVLDG